MEDIKKQINELSIDEGIVKRISEVRIECLDRGKRITAWQCSMIDMIKATIKYYSILEIILDENGIVTDATLSDDFKGSHGPLCRPDCLQVLIKKYLIGMSFDNDCSVFRNKNQFACRHTFELIAAAITFYRFCDFTTGQKEYVFSDITRVSCEDGVIATSNGFEINGDSYLFTDRLLYRPGDVNIDDSGLFCDMDNFKMDICFTKNGEELLKYVEEFNDLHGDTAVKNRFMRSFVALWNKISRICGTGKDFYFTSLQPITLSGMIFEIIVRVIRADNLSCFVGLLQHLQHFNGVPLCLGMIKEEAGLREFFPDIFS